LEFVFDLAQRLFPYNQLIYNDDSTWWNYQGDCTPAYMLVRGLQDHGLRVGGMGLQYHMFDNMKSDNCCGFNRPLDCRHLLKCLDQYGKLGIPLNFSEVSIISGKDLGEGDRFQELVTEKLYRLWFSHPAVEAIVWWNLVDGTAAYAPMGTEEGENRLRAGLVNFDFSPKPAYTALRRLIHEEWSTRCAVHYEDGATNCFHGFHGGYDAVIETNAGKTYVDVALGAKDENIFNIKLPCKTSALKTKATKK
jgi:GH35 family endo-1,4-beta-xylanase